MIKTYDGSDSTFLACYSAARLINPRLPETPTRRQHRKYLQKRGAAFRTLKQLSK